jgi:hypothetical protein
LLRILFIRNRAMPAGSGEQRAGSLLFAEVRQGAMSVAPAASRRQFVNLACPAAVRPARRPEPTFLGPTTQKSTRSHRTRHNEGQLYRLPLATNQPLFVGAGGVGVLSLFDAMDSIMRLQLSIMQDIFCCMS